MDQGRCVQRRILKYVNDKKEKMGILNTVLKKRVEIDEDLLKEDSKDEPVPSNTKIYLKSSEGPFEYKE